MHVAVVLAVPAGILSRRAVRQLHASSLRFASQGLSLYPVWDSWVLGCLPGHAQSSFSFCSFCDLLPPPVHVMLLQVAMVTVA